MKLPGRGVTSSLVGYLMAMNAAHACSFGINGSLSRLLFAEGVSLLTLVELRMITGSFCLPGFLLLGNARHSSLPGSNSPTHYNVSAGAKFPLVSIEFLRRVAQRTKLEELDGQQLIVTLFGEASGQQLNR